ncbi:MAG TPA: Holliday junction branch migration DNA helicase RuvB [bacterium]|nr:Holliday junction branch migration DNA helicase RuvB [bacterium]HOL47841.1 Holliday junction branch migration DNA helicase RuvB [bacterium]HPQ19554.1 Holliday junction branch migration DNA helicase RuvB [bacterium]
MKNKIINEEIQTIDEQLDISLRPKKFEDFIGQKQIIENLKIYIKAALNRGEPLDHTLLYGPPGLGKTTLANIIANELGVNIKSTSGPVIEKAGDLAAILTNLQKGEVLFIDEIHRLNKVIEEILYPAIEDFRLDIIIGQGPAARTIKLNIPEFTLIGATTRIGLISAPLRSRFGIISRLDFYNLVDMKKIVLRAAKILNIAINEKGAEIIAKSSRGTPRISNRLIKRIRDFAEVKGEGIITEKIAKDALNMLEIDEYGLDQMDRKLLEIIINKYNGGPVGLSTLAVSLNEEKETIEEVYEPYLIQIGFLKRTTRGREATESAYKHIGISYNKKNVNNDLFSF